MGWAISRRSVARRLFFSGMAAVESLEARRLLAGIQFLPSAYDVHDRGAAIVSGDFTGDTHRDVAFLTPAGQPRVVPGNGDGAFGAVIKSPDGYGTPQFVRAGDVNADGRLDLITADTATNRAVLYVGNGDGTFQSPLTYVVGREPLDLALGDFNADGRPDFVTANRGTANVSVMLGAAGGTPAFQAAPPLTAGARPAHLAVADFDGDGRADVMVADLISGIALFPGNGDGTFRTPVALVPSRGSTHQTGIIAADLTSDARPDLVLVRYGVDPLIVFRNLGGGAFAFGDVFGYGSGANTAYVVNFTNDGKPDLLLDGEGGGTAPFTGVGDGTFASAFPYDHPPEGMVAWGDYNGDGLSDVAAVSGFGRLDVAMAKPLVGFATEQGNSHSLNNVTLATGESNIAPDVPVSGVTATVDWGDGRTSGATVVPEGNGRFRVTGSHVYPQNRVYTFRITLMLPGGRSFLFAERTVDVRTAPAPPSVSEFQAGSGGRYPDFAAPGPGGDIWFSQNYPTGQGGGEEVPHVARLGADGTLVAAVPLGGNWRGPRPIASDTAGNAWTPLTSGTALGRVDPTNRLTVFAIPSPVVALTRGPDGNVWFIDGQGIGSVTPAGQVTRTPYSQPPSLTPTRIAFGPDGNIWATLPRPSKIVRITRGGTVTEFAVPAPTGGFDPNGPRAIAPGPDGQMWFIYNGGSGLGRISMSGAVSDVPVPVELGAASNLVSGPDGAVWLTRSAVNRVARVTPDGAYREYSIPTFQTFYPGLPGNTSWPFDLLTGADGNIWFSEQAAGRFGRVNLDKALRLDATPFNAARKGVPFSGEVARFTDGIAGRSADDYEVRIDWGDGSSGGTLVALPGGGYSVRGEHTYANEGNHTVRVTVTPFGDVSTTTAFKALVDYPLTAPVTYRMFGTESKPTDNTPLVSFRDTDPDGVFGPFTASIEWGDGLTSNGTVAAAPGGPTGTLEVRATHTYADEGSYPVRVTVRDAGGSTLVAETEARVADAAALLPAVGYAAPSGRIAVGDFDGDGRLDVVSGMLQVPQLVVLRGAGGGSFEAAKPVGSVTGNGVTDLAAADFNRDGRDDVVAVSMAGGGTAHVFRGNADGTFTAAGTFPSANWSVLTGDLDNDGDADVVTFNSSGRVVALNDGAGNLAASAQPSGSSGFSGRLADIDRDGRLDLVTAHSGDMGVSVWPGRGDGTFGPPDSYTGVFASQGANIAVADFNGDGHPDVAAADAGSNRLHVRFNAGDGTLGPAVEYVLDDAAGPGARVGLTFHLEAGDVNGDGVPDLLRASSNGVAHNLDVKLGQGAGAFRPFQTQLRYPIPMDIRHMTATADVNGDGRTDVIVGGAGQVGVLLNTPYALAVAPLTATEGAAMANAVVATITHEDLPTSSAGMTASVEWGDGETSAATLVANAAGGVDVVASHTYRRAGSHSVRVTVIDRFGVRSVAGGAVAVANAPLSARARTFPAVRNAPVTAVVASFSDANPFGQLADFSATIDWGDGRSSAGLVRADPGAGPGWYTVTGTQTYGGAGTFPVRVTITDNAAGTAAGSSVTVTGTARVTAPANGGGWISGTFHNDQNFNGIRETLEPPLTGWTAYVDANNNGVLDAGERFALTSESGDYTIADVPAGTWAVRQVVEQGWRATSPAANTAHAVTMTTGQAAGGANFLNTRRPAAVVDAGPPARNTAADQLAITFNEPVTGFDLSDLTLRRDGGANLLAGGGGFSLTTSDNARYTLGGLSAVTAQQGVYTLTLTAAGSGVATPDGHALVEGAVGIFVVDLAAPTVTSRLFDPRGAGRVVVTFSEPVGESLQAGDLLVVDLAAPQAPAVPAGAVSWDPTTNAATFSFTGGGMPHGNYRAVLAAEGITDAAGNALAAGSPPLEFFVLNGDLNRDRSVNGSDFAVLAGNFGKGGMTYAQGDLNGDGSVNGSDFAILAGNFGKTVPAPAPAAPAVAVAGAVQTAPRRVVTPQQHPPAKATSKPDLPRTRRIVGHRLREPRELQ